MRAAPEPGSTVCAFWKKFLRTSLACGERAGARQDGMKHIMQFLTALLDFALPRRCAGCGDMLGEGGDFCLICWASLRHLDLSGCPLCGVPMAISGQICGACLAQPPVHNGVMAAVAYDDVARSLVLKLKYGRKPGMARVMARLMARLVRSHPSALLIPVPLHRWRLWARGYNQSLLLARALSQITGQKVLPDSLVRTRRTQPLGGLGRAARLREVRRVFALRPTAISAIKGQDVLLVDDVYTSGATAGACVEALKRAGAAQIRVLTWARVLDDMSGR